MINSVAALGVSSVPEISVPLLESCWLFLQIFHQMLNVIGQHNNIFCTMHLKRRSLHLMQLKHTFAYGFVIHN